MEIRYKFSPDSDSEKVRKVDKAYENVPICGPPGDFNVLDQGL